MMKVGTDYHSGKPNIKTFITVSLQSIKTTSILGVYPGLDTITQATPQSIPPWWQFYLGKQVFETTEWNGVPLKRGSLPPF